MLCLRSSLELIQSIMPLHHFEYPKSNLLKGAFEYEKNDENAYVRKFNSLSNSC